MTDQPGWEVKRGHHPFWGGFEYRGVSLEQCMADLDWRERVHKSEEKKKAAGVFINFLIVMIGAALIGWYL